MEEEITEEDLRKIRQALSMLASKADKLAEDLRKETLKNNDHGMTGIGVFLLMLDANAIADPLFDLHQLLNIRPEYRKESRT